ncbi:MAG: amino acid adenylation domain-containing protein [Nostoc sp. DedSLP03]|uniref:non-ribosomal peptide synthetase n=1 Tax=Nostoc sp. DedSLP03 TaxID=3075400 RepID=UPI002AD30982|nr:non-ribosomal peptide synthetase [Nostoc sp. DedSLP03]MDZ7965826.1 amino acid adenylation domain-containing protein [Nostoc sp. DedSLP03]
MDKRYSHLSLTKKALLEKWKAGQFTEQAISKRPFSDHVPLSFSQQQLWFIDQYYHGSPFYNILGALHLKERLNVTAFKQSLNEILRRHEAWRTTFVTVNGQPRQVIAPELTWDLPIINLEHLSGKHWEPEVQQLATEEAKKPFDLAQGPLVRATLLRLSKEEHVFLLTMHHIVSDGWSSGVFMRELATLYATFSTDQPSPLPELPIQYADFAVWQHDRLQGELLKTQLNYWKQQLSGDLPVLRLPTDRLRPGIATFTGSKEYFTFSKTLTKALNKLSQQEEATLFMTLLAGFNTLLYRYTEQEDILVGSSIANRNRAELEGMLGFFVNTLVMRNDLSGNPSFRQLLSRVREVTLDAYAHQDLPFEKLVEELQPERNLSRNLLFQVMFVLQNAPMPLQKVSGLTLRTLEVDSGTAMFDMFLSIAESEQELTGFLEYNTDLFDSATITRLIKNFQTLLESIVANPNLQISEFQILTVREREQLLIGWNDTGSDYPQNACLHKLFEQQVEHSPNALALIGQSDQLTYKQLNQKANQLAHYLQKLGVTTETFVAICLEQSVEMVIGILAILKAGGAYIPLDPNYPSVRLDFMLSDSQASVLLTQQGILEKLPKSSATTICLNVHKDAVAQESQENPISTFTANHLAYVIYTSGSTGTPKGVLGTHKGTVNGLQWLWKTYPFETEEICCQKSGISFVDSVWELFAPLLQGIPSVIIPDTIVKDTQLFIETLSDRKVTRLILVPSLLQVLVNSYGNLTKNLSKLKLWITSGEVLSLDLARAFQELMPTAKLINLYGSSEVSANVTCYDTSLLPEKPSSVPIGRPIDNTQVYVLDPYLQAVPVGVFGELYISGDGLARSYLNHSELTHKRFIDNPFVPGSKIYKTGDLVRYLNDGNLEYLGRHDDQIKIRGFRVELREIEAVIAQYSDVRECVVIAIDDPQSEKRLIAYVVTETQNLVISKENQPQTELYTEQLSEWEKVWDETYTQPSVPQDPTFNIVSWNSSYTGNPIPPKEMQDWVNYTIERILEKNPTRVLEIGCGVGLLLFRLAPLCTKYVGTDFSQTALDYLGKQLLILKQAREQVTLFQKNANDFEGIDADSLNTVILNSVIQYFPSINYLLHVLEGSVNAVEPGGFVFVGDVRNFLLLEPLHASVELYKASDELTKVQLQQRVQKRLTQEKELVIDPAFFIALKQHIPKISHVQIQPKRGRHSNNEVTKYRYDVTLHIGATDNSPVKISWMDWREQMLTLSSVRQLIEQTQPEFLGLTGVPNARISTDIKMVEWLTSYNNSQIVGEFRSALEESVKSSEVDPEDFWDLSQDLGYTVEISWIGSDRSGSYNVLFKRDKTAVVKFPGENARVKLWNVYANNPLQGKFARNLVPRLRSKLQENLPEYMVPSAFVMLDAIPLTPSGKLDKRLLPADDVIRSHSTESFAAPQNHWELALVQIWENLLNISPIGVTDNFFELGGHSLLAARLMAQIHERFGQNLPLSTLFEGSTIKQLAKILSQQISSGSRSPVVAIRSSGSRIPFFCVHPAGGSIIAYPKMASKLDLEQPFYALEQSPNQHETDIVSVEETAAYYIEEIRVTQPEGPYLLGGWCYGGMIAFEMAQQLRRQDQNVCLLAVFDAVFPKTATHIIKDDAQLVIRIAGFLKNFFGIDVPLSYNELQQFPPDEQFKLLMRKANIVNDAELQQFLRIYKLFKAHIQAMRDYVPQVYPGEITLFRATDEITHDFQNSEFTSDDPLLGWGKYSEQPIKLIEVPGNHFSMFTEPYVQELARQLRRCFDDIKC